MALAAEAMPGLADKQVVATERMALNAVSFLRVQGAGAGTAQDVLARRHQFQVGRSYAGAVAAKVIGFQASRYRAADDEPCHSVRDNLCAWKVKLAITSPVQSSLPVPAVA